MPAPDVVLLEDADVIWRAPRTRIFFRPNPTDDETPRVISDLLGKTTLLKRTPASDGRIAEVEIERELSSAERLPLKRQ